MDIREMIRDLIDAEPTTGRSGEIADQIMSLFTSHELPTLEQMQELINLAYGLGWKDRKYAIWNTTPPTVTIAPRPDGTWLFLYDGKPRP
jgi:hypothetical protein